MPKKGAPRKQPRVIQSLVSIAGANAYMVLPRKKDPQKKPDQKTFLPDVIATPFKGKGRVFFEVEATVTNNTVYKSLVSLLQFLANNNDGNAYLVVPKKAVEFTKACLEDQKRTIRAFGKTVKGANPKINLEVLSFDNVSEDETKIAKWFQGKRVGAPPKCRYLPRPT